MVSVSVQWRWIPKEEFLRQNVSFGPCVFTCRGRDISPYRSCDPEARWRCVCTWTGANLCENTHSWILIYFILHHNKDHYNNDDVRFVSCSLTCWRAPWVFRWLTGRCLWPLGSGWCHNDGQSEKHKTTRVLVMWLEFSVLRCLKWVDGAPKNRTQTNKSSLSPERLKGYSTNSTQ